MTPRRLVGEPVAGHWRRRLVKGGPWVGVITYYACPMDPESGEPMQRSRPLLCQVDGEQAEAIDQWSWIAGQPITPKEYAYLRALGNYAFQFEPNHPAAKPRQPIDLLTAPLPYQE